LISRPARNAIFRSRKSLEAVILLRRMESVGIFVKFFALAFSALLPVINPFGSALVFLGLVGGAPPPVIRDLSRKIAVSTLLFLAIIQLVGTALLAFFGISLPVVQVAGGLVLAAMGWNLLNEADTDADRSRTQIAADSYGPLEQKVFYPFTFPVTAGPGTVVVMLTLSAHATVRGTLPDILAHIGIFIAVCVLSVLVFLSYAYAPWITRRMSPQTAHGILRVIAFVLLCIGVQITWNGVQAMLKTVLK
jgi:multiple antibiotic resistance protein